METGTLESMINHFRDGGWTMYLVFIVGLTGTGAAGRFAWRGEHQLLGFIRWNLLTLTFASWFGFCTGMLNVFAYILSRSAPEERLLDLMQGIREALNNPTAGLMFATLIGLLGAVGMRRFPLPNPSAAPR